MKWINITQSSNGRKGQVIPVHKKQLLPYLQLADMRLGLLINFGSPLIKLGITRIVNGLEE